MRHVTDGELHTYLDGALDLLPEGRGDEVREHLGSCPVCQERLQDEEKVRGQAQSLLDLTAPKELALPPFEELRVRAEAAERREEEGVLASQAGSPRYRGPLKAPSLAWAATIVLALGVGWMGGEVWRTGPEDLLQDSYFPETLAEPASESLARKMAPPPPVGALEEARMDEMVRTESEAPATGGAGELGTDPARALLTPPVLTPAFPLGAASETVLENSLAVPGLEVLSVEWEEWVPGERGLHIRQLLPMGDTLELRYLGMLMGADLGSAEEALERGGIPDAVLPDSPPFPKGMEASLPPGWNQVVMKKKRGWLVARAPLPEASLRALLRSLQ